MFFDNLNLKEDIKMSNVSETSSKLEQRVRAIVFDFDDAIFVSYRSPSNGYLSYLKFAAKTKTICRLSAGKSAANFNRLPGEGLNSNE